MTADAIWWTGNTSKSVVGVPVEVLATRRNYGLLQARIQPVGGQGFCWVSVHKLDQWRCEPIWLAVTLDTRQLCSECGWLIMSDTIHYKAKDQNIHHCTTCHPMGTNWEIDGDSARARIEPIG